MTQKVLSYDLGGTKIAAGVVNRKGQILDEVSVPAEFSRGKKAVLNQIITLGQYFLSRHSEINHVGIASAGPLDPEKGILLSPTNFSTANKKWGKVPITEILGRAFHKKVYLENDAAAAVLAEHWIGAGKRFKNVMVLTLGTGLGTGIICNDALVRAGRHLHPEAGHLILNYQDRSALCGCGNYGCAEAYLSGKHFARRASLRLKRKNLSAREIADLARAGNPRALQAFDEYSTVMSVAIQNYIRLYTPEIIVLTGSFAQTADLFLKSTQAKLTQLLARQADGLKWMPQIKVSTLQNEAGLIGGAYVAFLRSRA
jgi:glucokinase